MQIRLRKYIGPKEENIIRAVGVATGIALVGMWIVADYAWYDPRAWMYSWTIALAGGYMASRQLQFRDKSRLSKKFAVFAVLTIIGRTLAGMFADPLTAYTMPKFLLLILGAVIFFVSFDAKAARRG